MYLSYYNLQQKPFQITTDPGFLWLGEKHQEALATLKYGILGSKGFLLLTGDVGTGKTTLINALLNNLAKEVIVATVFDPGLEQLDFYNFVANAFGMNREFTSKGSFLIHFGKFLHHAYSSGKKVLLIIDEAQRIGRDLLEEVRLLSNIERPDAKLLNIFFIGQNEVNNILLKQENRAIRQRITINYNIEPLTENETAEYIRHRLRVAGTEKHIFNTAAIHEICAVTKGYPRLINVICDRALMTGFVEEVAVIGPNIIRECAEELQIAEFREKNAAKSGTGVNKTTRKPQKISHPGPSPQQVPESTPKQQQKNEAGEGGEAVQELPSAAVESNEKDSIQGRKNEKEQSVTKEKPARFRKSIFMLLGLFFLSAVLGGWYAYDSGKWRDFISFSGLGQKPPAGQNGGGAKFTNGITLQGNGNTLSAAQAVPKNNYVVLPRDKEDRPQERQISPPGDSVSEVLESTTTTIPQIKISDRQGGVSKVPETKKNEFLRKMPGTRDESSSEKREHGLLLGRSTVTIYFNLNSNTLSSRAIEALERFIKGLAMGPDDEIVVTGYTDSLGYEYYNKKLSEFRASIVKSYLMGKGVASGKVRVIGRGAENSIASNETPEGRLANRRVEVEIVAKREQAELN